MNPVESILAIQQLTQRYADAVMRLDFDALADCFTPDGQWEIVGRGVIEGRDQIIGIIQAVMGEYEQVLFYPQPSIINLDGVAATATCYVQEHLKKAGEFTRVFGRYSDNLNLYDGAWRFSSRRYEILAGL